jgi:glycosyltransferase involved in cell wall biosynthesis
LCLSPEIQTKPVRIIPEGIRLDPQEVRGEPQVVLEMLTAHPGRYRLSERFVELPVILNVGRLAPIKGQHRLVEAWAESSLRKRFVLVLIGGNLESPGVEEREMLAAIDTVVERHSDLEGRFCHLSALDNAQVRLLERVLVSRRQSVRPQPVPPVYLCSSLKEEFGISILEAMSAGFLIMAPRRGGVSTYVEDGTSGFLIDTSSSGSMRKALEAVLDSGGAADERLREIAERGRRFVAANFSIESIAGRFSDFYRAVVRPKPHPEGEPGDAP